MLAGPTPSTLTESLSSDLDNLVRTTCKIKKATNNCDHWPIKYYHCVPARDVQDFCFRTVAILAYRPICDIILCANRQLIVRDKVNIACGMK